VRALVPDGELYVRDPGRPLPPFVLGDLFPEGVKFRAAARGGRVELRPEAPSGPRL
jgi:hypothetical protein